MDKFSNGQKVWYKLNRGDGWNWGYYAKVERGCLNEPIHYVYLSQVDCSFAKQVYCGFAQQVYKCLPFSKDEPLVPPEEFYSLREVVDIVERFSLEISIGGPIGSIREWVKNNI